MNKKFLSAILFGALMVSSTGTFVSCKDYDDDIKDLQEQIDKQKTDLSDKVTAIESSIASLQTAQTGLEGKIAEVKDAAEKAALEAQKTAIAAAAEELAGVKAELEAAITKLQTATDEEIQAVKGDITEIEASIAEVNGKINALQAFQATTEETLAALADADTKLAGTLTALDAEVKANKVAIGKNEAAIDAQKKALEAYILSNDEAVAANKTAIEGILVTLGEQQEILDGLKAFDVKETQEDIATIKATLETMSTSLKGLSDQITAIDNKLEVLSAAIYKGVTHVSLWVAGTEPQNDWNLTFLSAEAVRTWTFGDKMMGAIEFVKGEKATLTESFLIRVSPTDAVVSAENIKLINGEGTDLEGLVSVKEVKSYKGQFTRGISETGVWEVVVEMNKDYDEAKFKEATVAKDKNGKYTEGEDTKYNLYAVSLNSTLGEKEGEKTYSRSVVSEYNLAFTTDNINTSAELSFTVDDKAVAKIANRYAVLADSTWKDGVKAEPIFSGKDANTEADDSDDRDGKQDISALPVTLNKPFTVKVEDENVEGFYVVIDYARAGDSDTSEKVAWQKYEKTMTGLKTVSKTGSVELTITDADALTDYICFRVYAVNKDGSLVDPDGKAFEVVVGEAADALGTYNCTWTWKAANEEEYTMAEVASDVFAGDWVKNVAEMKALAPGDTIVLDKLENSKAAITDLEFYGEDKTSELTGGLSAIAKDIKYVKAVINTQDGADATWYDNGKKYTQTYGFYNDRGQLLKTITVTLTKVMPGFPASVAPFTNILVNNTLKVYPKIEKAEDANVLYELDNVWHGITTEVTFAQKVTGDEEATVTYIAKDTDVKPALQAPKAILNPEADEYGTKYPMVVSYDYGDISSWVETLNYQWIVEGTNFDVVFGNYIDDCTFTWSAKPTLTYPGSTNVTQKLDLSKLIGKDWYGKNVYIYNNTVAKIVAFNDYGTIAEDDVEVITSNSATGVNEYYTAKFVETTYNDDNSAVKEAAHILLTSNSVASQGSDVETVIRLKVKDIYGNIIKKDLPAFTMKFQNK